MEEAVILSAVRTPIGRYGGVLKDVRPDDLAALVIAEAVQRAQIDAGSVEDVIFGAANQSGEDDFALRSHQRAVAAQQAGRFAAEMLPVTIPQKKGEPVVVAEDESPRPDTSLEKLATLKPVFRQGGTVTAGNAAGINDGAAALVLMSLSQARALGLQPRARIVATAVAGVDPAYMGLGPIPATRKALQRAGLSLQDIDLVELNEAFAAQSLQCVRELEIDQEKLNVNGGAIALGHPLGCSGARIVVTLLHELERREGRYGLATMCIGVGQGIATIIERI